MEGRPVGARGRSGMGEGLESDWVKVKRKQRITEGSSKVTLEARDAKNARA